MVCLQRTQLAAAALAAFVTHSAAAAPASAELSKLLRQLNERLIRLEQRNAELEARLKSALEAPRFNAQPRLEALEQTQEKLQRGLQADDISQYEPELTARLKAAEKDVLDMRKAAKKVDALDGLTANVALTTVLQKPLGLPSAMQDAGSQINYRADVALQLPLEPMGSVEHKLYAHFRLGQGQGLNEAYGRLGALAGAPNAVAFRASGANADDAPAILGEAWYQARIPLPLGGHKAHSRQGLELSFGKMDLFGFFDQNAVAGDEARQFLNSVFVHNPLLDAGAQIGADANGFQPGVVASYVDSSHKTESWRLSLGAFASGRGAAYQHVAAPLLLAQAETALRWNGLPGNYRVYLWRNAQGTNLDATAAAHSGWGASLDQGLGDGLAAFARYGQLRQGTARFDRALTVGAELGGGPWSRAADALGLAVGRLRASNTYRAQGGSGALSGDASAVFNFLPAGGESVFELYYRYRLNKQFEISPDIQYQRNLGANPQARPVKALGLRLQFSY